MCSKAPFELADVCDASNIDCSGDKQVEYCSHSSAQYNQRNGLWKSPAFHHPSRVVSSESANEQKLNEIYSVSLALLSQTQLKYLLSR